MSALILGYHTHMAYNPVNKYYRAYLVQEVYNKYKQEGVTAEFIYNTYIKAAFLISKRTFYNDLAVPAKIELIKIGLPFPQNR